MRFNGTVRSVSSILFVLNVFLFLPVTIYMPALAFTQGTIQLPLPRQRISKMRLFLATSVNVHFVTPVICGVCIFYTTIGGLKAVVWSDALQFTAMMGAMGATFYLGLVNVGGFGNIWNISKEGGRLDIK